MSYTREHEGAQAEAFTGSVDWTDETAEANPDWSLDLSDQEIGEWRGPDGQRGVITLVWGVSLVASGAVATAELGPATTDQCPLVDDRFTLVSLDDYVGDLLEIRLYGQRAPSWRANRSTKTRDSSGGSRPRPAPSGRAGYRCPGPDSSAG